MLQQKKRNDMLCKATQCTRSRAPCLSHMSMDDDAFTVLTLRPSWRLVVNR